jgi:hypothetical protein
MTFLVHLPAGLSLLVLAAHFYRAGHYVIAVATLALFSLFAVPKPWAARALQATLLLGASEWIRTTAFFISLRRDAGRPWGRLAVILAAVTLLTALSALVFESARLRKRYGLSGLTRGR